MSNIQAKGNIERKSGSTQVKGKSDMLFYVVAVVVVAASLIFMPKVLGFAGVSFLAAGSGLNKLLTFIVAAVLGWVSLLSSQSYKDFLALAKGARTEWRKTVKPDRDMVTKTTMMVLVLVALFALLILLLDWIFGSILLNLLV